MATAIELAWLTSMVCPAQASQRKWGVPASVTLAQCVLESGWGQDAIAKTAHNYFGIKAVEGQDYREFDSPEDSVNGATMEQSAFAVYPSAMESFDAHGRLLASLPRYVPAMAVRDDIPAFCVELQNGGYSTSRDPLTHKLNYAHRLMRDFILPYRLLQYDITPQPDKPVAVQEAA